MLFLLLAPTFISPTFAQTTPSKRAKTKKTTVSKAKAATKKAVPPKGSVTNVPPTQTTRSTTVKQDGPSGAAPIPQKPYVAPTLVAPAKKLVTPKPAAPAGPPPSPWRLSYFGEYAGPQLGNIDLGRATSGPTDTMNSSWAEWDHYVKIGYAINNTFTLGTQIRAVHPNDPTMTFYFKDLRFFLNWGNMVSTKDIDMSMTLVAEFPTTDISKQRGKLFSFQLKNNWTLKTSLRNWSFTATTLINPVFYETYGANGAGTNDFNVAIYPWITADIVTNLQFLIDASLEASHSYDSENFNFIQGGADFIGLGVVWTLNEHLSVNPEIRPWLDDISLKKAALYLGVSAAL